jgi:hypothetical protein
MTMRFIDGAVITVNVRLETYTCSLSEKRSFFAGEPSTTAEDTDGSLRGEEGLELDNFTGEAIAVAGILVRIWHRRTKMV